MLTTLYTKLLVIGRRLRDEERGDSLVNWVVLAVGLAAAAAAVVALVGPAIGTAAQKIVNSLGG
jgi:hypothetical protein